MAGSARDRYLRKTYDLSEEEYDRLAAAQDNMCAICGTRGRLVVDHDHRQGGRVRGLLCSFLCNYRLLAKGLDNARLHEAAAKYLADPPAAKVGLDKVVPKKEEKK